MAIVNFKLPDMKRYDWSACGTFLGPKQQGTVVHFQMFAKVDRLRMQVSADILAGRFIGATLHIRILKIQ